MNTILFISLVISTILALTSANPAPDPAQKARVVSKDISEVVAAKDEALQPEESRWGHGGGGWGNGGGGWGHGGGWGRGYGGGWGRGGGWGQGGGWGHGGGWGRGGWGR